MKPIELKSYTVIFKFQNKFDQDCVSVLAFLTITIVRLLSGRALRVSVASRAGIAFVLKTSF